ncbi:MAG: thermonuclease family protein [Armatimonadetes bacterium]|nr:thermonuclease family protein [Armatimonadota bacterium]MDW8154811.1 thermonuclease family protein [Armatimonadota bacterium]
MLLLPLALLLAAPALAARTPATVRLQVGPRTETVRLIGLDAPETSPNHRAARQAGQLGRSLQEILRLGELSRAAAGRLAPPGSTVFLELDVQTRDRYGRLLAYLWLPDGTLLNERLLRDGWAVLLTVPPTSGTPTAWWPPSARHATGPQACGPLTPSQTGLRP